MKHNYTSAASYCVRCNVIRLYLKIIIFVVSKMAVECRTMYKALQSSFVVS